MQKSRITQKVICGNWKMNPMTLKDAEKLFSDVAKSVSGIKKTQIVICSPFVYLEKLKKLSRRINLGAQTAFWADAGPFTGEISPDMLYGMGIRYVILGHSERRALGETNTEVNQKIKASLAAGLTIILCVGENSRDETHSYFNFVKSQIEECLAGISKNSISKILIAYEPIWAISSTPNHTDATAHDSLEMSLFIKKTIVDKFGIKIDMPRILYGGDVNEKNAQEFLQYGGVDGVLVGRASLDAKKFLNIIHICEALDK